MKPLWKHQKQTVALRCKQPRVFDTSDPGTGKTRAHLAAYTSRKRRKCALVVAPRTGLQTAWGDEIDEYFPGVSYICAYASNREWAFQQTVDVYITNTDAVKWLAKQSPKFFDRFDELIIDECFPAGTLVDTPEGPTPIEMLKAGSPIFTSSGIMPVTNTMSRMAESLVQLELANGQTIICTPDHPIATENGWRKAGGTGGLQIVQTALHKYHQPRSKFLYSYMFEDSDVGSDVRGTEERNLSTSEQSQYGPPRMEYGAAFIQGYKEENKRQIESWETPTKSSRGQWQDSSLREDDVGNASVQVEVPGSYTNRVQPTIWQWISNLLQGRFWRSEEKTGNRSRWNRTQCAEALGCEERFFAGLVRVDRISYIQCKRPTPVYNLHIDGPETYSVAGVLVHNCDSFKHRTSQRSKAIAKIVRYFPYRAALTGTPNSTSITDLWHQVFLLDDGQRLGRSFFAFRNNTCAPVQVGPLPNHLRWEDKEGIEQVIGHMIKDISIRHDFDECMDIPPNHQYTSKYRLPSKLQAIYDKLVKDTIVELENDTISAINQASLRTKLLQVASGAVYSEKGYALLDTDRYEYVLDLVTQRKRKHSIVFFNWRHQRDQFTKMAEAMDISFTVLDGSINKDRDRAEIIGQFQRGAYQVIFLHPQTGAHTLTLTKATTTIWTSPSDRADHIKQGGFRARRGGQTHRTETIMVEALNTIEGSVYAQTAGKGRRMGNLLEILRNG